MSMEGFEWEILTLLKRMKERKDQKGKLDSRERKKLELSRFERELRKLECTVNYIGEGKEKGGNIFRKLRSKKCQGVSFAGLRVGRYGLKGCCWRWRRSEKRPLPFRFENMWLKMEGFKDLLKSWWEEDNFSGSSARNDLALNQVDYWDAKEKTNPFFGGVEARKEDFVKDDVMRFFGEFYEHENGFWEKWVGWIKWCISIASFSMLMAPVRVSFKAQGAVDGGFLLGCRVKGRSEEGVQISHLLFVDDTLVFFQASQDQLTYLSRVENIDDVALDFGCRVGSLPSTYLGLLLGAPFKSVTVLDGVEERFLRREVWGRERGWCSREVREAHGVGLWKGLRMEWDFVGSRISFLVGGGNLLGVAAWEESAQRCGRHGVLDRIKVNN
ncbi:hypothetical protein CK203_066071 [Vitis vinifera]|uniref:Reverse transcriptase domain-containing protein n=1 Tax=Vitis vinifera TaxID=29760 RepID=A0A438G2Q5_VITVI|nr:hypothetical protein CK203_066071 [Vitis vinifera]